MIVDASAVLAYLHEEEGGLAVEKVLRGAFISTVNWCEVVQKLRLKGIDDKAVGQELKALGVSFIPFMQEHAEKAGELWRITSPFGLSLGDRACLATALIEGLDVLTADKAWRGLPLDLQINLIR
jgi:PIN domain nuclease of toxin-antitoxin system